MNKINVKSLFVPNSCEKFKVSVLIYIVYRILFVRKKYLVIIYIFHKSTNDLQNTYISCIFSSYTFVKYQLLLNLLQDVDKLLICVQNTILYFVIIVQIVS